MGLIAEMCPRCRRITRCVVTDNSSVIGGMIFGIPFILPMSSVQCVCGECGQSFKSRAALEARAIPAEVAVGLANDSLLGLTNPELQMDRILSERRADPRLGNAFALFDRLSPGPLRFGLEADLARWLSLGELDQAELFERVEECAKAEAFARAMARRYTSGATGCLLGAAVAAGVWIAGWMTLDRPGTLAIAFVGFAGLVAGSLPYQLLSVSRDRKWVRDVLLPEADQAGVSLKWVLAVLEKTSKSRGSEDEFGSFRDVAPAIRAELVVAGRGSLGDEVAGFGPPVGDPRKS